MIDKWYVWIAVLMIFLNQSSINPLAVSIIIIVGCLISIVYSIKRMNNRRRRNATRLFNKEEIMNKTKIMLEEIMFLAADEIESRIQENKIGANYDIKASEKDLKSFKEFIYKDYVSLLNALHYAIIELREWNPESEAATKLEEILKSFQ